MKMDESPQMKLSANFSKIDLAEFFKQRGGIHQTLDLLEKIRELRRELLSVPNKDSRRCIAQEISRYIEFIAEYESLDDEDE